MANARAGRCPDWTHEETMLLVKSKEEAFLKHEEGGEVWAQIAEKFSNTPGISAKSKLQCQRRWDTLRKAYIRIQDYCLETGKNDQQLDGEELMRSMKPKLATAYHEDWYNIVKRVCSQQRKNIGRKNASTVEKSSKRLKLDPSHPASLPQFTGPGSGVLSVTSTSTSSADFSSFTCLQRTPHIQVEELGGLSSDLIPHNMSFVMSPRQSSHGRCSGATDLLEAFGLQDFSSISCPQGTPHIQVEELGGFSSDPIPYDVSFVLSPLQSSHDRCSGATDLLEAFGLQDFSSISCPQGTPHIQVEELGGFSSDPIPYDVSFVLSPLQSSHDRCSGATDLLEEWTYFGNDGADPGLIFSNTCLRIEGLNQVMLEETSRIGPRYGIKRRRCKSGHRWKVEMRVKSLGRKVWLGTYKSTEQAKRAFDVCKFFFGTVVETDYNFPETPGILLQFSTVMGQLSRHKELKLVKDMARLYANMGERISEIFVGWEVGFRAGVYSAELTP